MTYYKNVASGTVFELPDSFDMPNGSVRVVVINPEDREQVERLAEALCAVGMDSGPTTRTTGGLIDWAAVRADNTQAALRSLIAPPRPPEPQGLGAVVVDKKGRTWVRVEPADCNIVPWSPTWSRLGDDAQPADYEGIAVVRVLSEGVTP